MATIDNCLITFRYLHGVLSGRWNVISKNQKWIWWDCSIVPLELTLLRNFHSKYGRLFIHLLHPRWIYWRRCHVEKIELCKIGNSGIEIIKLNKRGFKSIQTINSGINDHWEGEPLLDLLWIIKECAIYASHGNKLCSFLCYFWHYILDLWLLNRCA